jgi:hypothetical protein
LLLLFCHRILHLLVIWLPMTMRDWRPLVQDLSVFSNAWPVSYKTVASSSSAVERRAPSTSELTLIRSLRDQLKNTQHQLKAVTAKVDVALSKASRAADAEKFLLEEIESLGKSLKCESFKLFGLLCGLGLWNLTFFSPLQMYALTVKLKPNA